MTPQTLSANLMACLGHEDTTDLHLLGSDGVKVPAFRAILACRSDVLRKMLCGNFTEATADVVALGYDSEALRAVVEFCITDRVRCFEGRVDEAATRGVVQLVACAHFLDMPLLQDAARALAKSLLRVAGPVVCAMFDEASLLGAPTESIKLEALRFIRKFPDDHLLSTPRPGIACLGPGALTELVNDDELLCEEITIFRALYEWATGTHVSGGSRAERASIAEDLAATHIRFASILPAHLVGIVRQSGIVDDGTISAALKARAALAREESDAGFSRKRKVHGVQVSGAGIESVNGFYEEDGEYEGYPKYTKTCAWQVGDKNPGVSEERTLCIYMHFRKKNGTSTWYITMIGKDGGIGSTKNDVYCGSGEEDVPTDGWELCRLGKNPCPIGRQW